LDLALKYQSELFVLTVVHPPEFAEDVETESVIEHSKGHHEMLLVPLKEQVASLGLRAQFEVAVGHPAEQIIFHSEQHGVDLIVLGHRGKSLIKRLLLGSVSQRVIQYADCPVMVVR
jgi:nucleotide-binding universal stress UspA family protein